MQADKPKKSRKRTIMNKNIFHKNPLIVYMILFSLIMEIIGILVLDDKKSFTIGLVFGLVFSILKLMLMKNSIKKAVTMPEAKAQTYTNVQYLIRYVLTGIVLFVAALEPSISLLGVFFGLLSMKLAAYMQYFSLKKAAKKQA
ncbi:MAG: ATP synthase subunit I [Cellulosilyticum sp.]|nr:ATP synthase subunit I [Cellulosilyticum sp.]